jgi:hypothetical protein
VLLCLNMFNIYFDMEQLCLKYYKYQPCVNVIPPYDKVFIFVVNLRLQIETVEDLQTLDVIQCDDMIWCLE